MIIARQVSGKLNSIRTIIRYILIALFIAIPWLRFNHRPAILLDISSRQFFFPGFVIWPQEFYYLMLVLLLSGLSLFLFTALFGRLWCGWACPQTVYTDLFDDVGRLLFPAHYGKRSERAWHTAIIHTLWMIISVVVTFHFVAYFVSIHEMVDQLLSLKFQIFIDYAWPYFVISIALLLYLDIAFLREHMCVYLCPYARFQAVMMDDDSIVIAYDNNRGEPRRVLRNRIMAASPPEDLSRKEGECTSCNMCSLVCPSGIDIRNGLQVSCIQCTRCIDACTRELAKSGLPSLVNFSSLRFFQSGEHAHFIRTRTVIYSGLMSVLFVILTVLAIRRVPMQVNVIRDPLLLPLEAGNLVQNYYKLNIGNMKELPARFTVEAKIKGEAADLEELQAISGIEMIEVEPNGLKHIPYILRGKLKSDTQHTIRKNIRVEFVIKDNEDPSNVTTKETLFTIPGS